MFGAIQGEIMKKISLTLGLVAFIFTGCFMIFDDENQDDKDCCENSYTDYRCRNNYSDRKRDACKDHKYRYDYSEKKSNIKPVRITPAKPKSNTSNNNSKMIHKK